MVSLLCSTLIMIFCANISFAVSKSSVLLQNWYDDLFFKDPTFNYESIRALGYAYTGGADLGEGISTLKAIKDSDINSWYQQWLATANRVENLAEKMEEQGDKVSAREAYFRASNYYRSAGFYMDAPKNQDKSIKTMKLSKKSFSKAIASLPYIKPVRIPYEKTTLPGYFIQSSKKNAPLLIVNTGFDGTAEELYFETGVAAHERDFNVLIFEGPGQGEVLRQQHLPFRYDWEHVVTPAIDFALTLPDIDKNKIALIGISMGGYLAARAAAFDNRIKACIVNGGIYDLSESLYKTLPPELIKLLKTDPAKFNEAIYADMKKNLTAQWYFDNAMWSFKVKTPAEVMLVMKKYTLKDVIEKIHCRMLVVDSEADTFFKGQPKHVYDLLNTKKTLLEFTRKETAQAHCQMGAMAISNEKILSWLNSVFSER